MLGGHPADELADLGVVQQSRDRAEVAREAALALEAVDGAVAVAAQVDAVVALGLGVALLAPGAAVLRPGNQVVEGQRQLATAQAAGRDGLYLS